MIHSLAIENFSSFHEPTFVEFTTGPKAGDRNIFLASSQGDTSINSVTGVFGANASGKTNLLKAIAFLRYFILDSASEKPDSKIPVEPFHFTEGAAERHQPIHFQLEFEYEEKLYRYELVISHQRVQSEALFRKDQRFRYLFERTWKPAQGDYEFKHQDIGPSKQVAQRENASFIASAVLQEHEFAKYISGYFKKCYVNVHLYGRMPTHDPESTNIIKAADYFSKHEDYLNTAIRHIAFADTGITNIDLETYKFIDDDGKEQSVLFPVAKHSVDGHDYKRPLIAESRGTQALFVYCATFSPFSKRAVSPSSTSLKRAYTPTWSNTWSNSSTRRKRIRREPSSSPISTPTTSSNRLWRNTKSSSPRRIPTLSPPMPGAWTRSRESPATPTTTMPNTTLARMAAFLTSDPKERCHAATLGSRSPAVHSTPP